MYALGHAGQRASAGSLAFIRIHETFCHRSRSHTPTHTHIHMAGQYLVGVDMLAWERAMGLPKKYEKTCVLILGWDEDCDDTSTAQEV